VHGIRAMMEHGTNSLRKFKVIFLGDMSVGKTSLIARYLHDDFAEKVDATVGMDFQSKNVEVGDTTIRLQLWDTAGQERFHSLVTSYIRDAAAAVIVYDISNLASYENTSSWLQAVCDARGDDVVVCLVGNKSDLATNVGKRAVGLEDARQKASEVGALFAETSAKSGENVADIFAQLAVALLPSSSAGSSTKIAKKERDPDTVKLSMSGSREDQRVLEKKCKC